MILNSFRFKIASDQTRHGRGYGVDPDLLERNRAILRDYYKLTDKHLTGYQANAKLMKKYKLSSRQIRTILNKMRMKQ
jgi:hypothetical protein